jgi:hypothetical protein
MSRLCAARRDESDHHLTRCGCQADVWPAGRRRPGMRSRSGSRVLRKPGCFCAHPTKTPNLAGVFKVLLASSAISTVVLEPPVPAKLTSFYVIHLGA